jgi:hypothetical protein
MEEAGLQFRATKDLDIVLHIEALDAAFGVAFWEFIERGEYEIREASDTGRPILYRFQKPRSANYPAMLELFCRAPDGIRLAEGAHLTPIPFNEAAASLSAILLDDEYYKFIISGRKNVDGLPWIGAEQLIPLKARAWLDLTARKLSGEKIDSRDVRLSQLLTPDTSISLARGIASDLHRFLVGAVADGSHDPRALQIDLTLDDIVLRLRRAYRLIE